MNQCTTANKINQIIPYLTDVIMNTITVFLIFVLAVSQSFAEELNMPFMDKNSMGVHQFIKSNPNADGRDVVIFNVGPYLEFDRLCVLMVAAKHCHYQR